MSAVPSVDPFSTTTSSASWPDAASPSTTSRTASSRNSASLKAGMTTEIIGRPSTERTAPLWPAKGRLRGPGR